MSFNAEYCDNFRYRLFFIVISVFGTLSLLPAEQTNDQNGVLSAIVQGVSYRDSLIKSASVNFSFEKYSMFEPGTTENENISMRGTACFVIKDDKMRLDMDYKQTVYAGSTDPRGEGGKTKIIKQTHYYSRNGLQALDKVEKKLTIQNSPGVPFVWPFSFGLNWDQGTNFETKRFGDLLSDLMKQGVVSLGGEEVFEGTKCYVVIRVYPGGGVHKLWIAPSQGYSVIKMTRSELASKGDSKRELVAFERVCSVTNIVGDLWLPVSGIEKYYSVSRTSTTIENLKLYVDRETRINVTSYELNKVSDNDVTPPSFNSGAYKSVWDTRINELIHLTNNPNMKNRE